MWFYKGADGDATRQNPARQATTPIPEKGGDQTTNDRKDDPMKDTKKATQATNPEASTTTTATETQSTPTTTGKRANRIAIRTEDTATTAVFFLTHRLVATIHQADTAFQENPDANRTANREAFRLFCIENAPAFGVCWQPEDQRTAINKRTAVYGTEEALEADAIAFLTPRIALFVEETKSGFPLVLSEIQIDEISPRTTTAKGVPLSASNIYEGRYLSGAWAWADITATVVLVASDTNVNEIYVKLDLQLVSGQIKKPTAIGDLGWNQTAFDAVVKAEMALIG